MYWLMTVSCALSLGGRYTSGVSRTDPKSEEHKAKISASLRGRTKTPEHKAAIAEGVRKFWGSPDVVAAREAANERREQRRRDGHDAG